jgi:hypothetical protein
MNNWKLKDSVKWKRKGSGHYELHASYIWKELEIHAEVIKQKSIWHYRLWTWGSHNPEPLSFSHNTFSTAKEIKKHVLELIDGGHPYL